ncbi:hypothetical protein ILYODFUR_013114 [Ilyodon furcidens]|uniref:Uncharacterized protein n=1 Tax=Ilyodon furcidens TaxID=33524 RepID=A0ABV0T7K9_9TELE
MVQNSPLTGEREKERGRFRSHAYLKLDHAEEVNSSDSALHGNRPSETEREILPGHCHPEAQLSGKLEPLVT